MNITQKEAIQLILAFLYTVHGFWADIPIDDPLIEEFISSGYADLDQEQGKYEINEQGTKKLYPHIEEITKQFTAYVKSKDFSCYNEEAIEWVSCAYGIDGETAEMLYDYITLVLEKFGYRRRSFHQKGKDGYAFIEC